MPIKQFTGKTAVITGAASGIGLSLSRVLLDRGCHVAMVDKNEGVREIAASVSSEKARAAGFCCDVSSRREVMGIVEEVKASFESIDIVINNAGVSVAGNFEEVSLDDFEWLMGINFWGVVYGCAAFLPALRRQSEGHIVNVCSSFGLLGFAKKSAYSASKFAVRGFSESLRAELMGSGLGVTVLYPGPVKTNIIKQGKSTSETQKEAEDQFLSNRAIDAKVVAEKTLRGIQKDAARVMISIDYHAIDWITRVSPTFAQWSMAKVSKKMPF